MTTPRFFIAHSKSCGDEDLDEIIQDASALLDRLSKGRAFSVTLGREYYALRFPICGSWDAWCNEVATGVEYGTRSPLFKAILVPDGRIGAAMSKIVERALAVGKPVIAFRAGGEARRVRSVVCVDRRDFKTGWGME